MISNPNILFVDDQQGVLDAIRRNLRSRTDRWRLHFATSAGEALEIARREPLDTIISDYNMPGMNGIELLEALARDEELATIPVIILTGNAETDLKRSALEAGALDLLNKPIAQEDLIARISSALRLRDAQEQLRHQNEILEDRVRARTASLERSRLEVVWRLAKAGEYRDEDTGNHVHRVAHFCKIMARAIGQTEEQAQSLFLASALHDIGKIGIPDSILLKENKLTPQERLVMQDHCRIGWNILTPDEPVQTSEQQPEDECGVITKAAVLPNPLLDLAGEIAMCHHERWDGTGYPRGLQGDQIPISARIVAIADVYDALRHGRPYKDPFDQGRALAIMQESTGTHFDPRLIDAFHGCLPDIEAIISTYADRMKPESLAA